jgi:hypothetical protein
MKTGEPAQAQVGLYSSYWFGLLAFLLRTAILLPPSGLVLIALGKLPFDARTLQPIHTTVLGNIAVKLFNTSGVRGLHLLGEGVIALTFIKVAFDQRVFLAAVAAACVEGFPFVLSGLFAVSACQPIPNPPEAPVQSPGAFGVFLGPALFMRGVEVGPLFPLLLDKLGFLERQRRQFLLAGGFGFGDVAAKHVRHASGDSGFGFSDGRKRSASPSLPRISLVLMPTYLATA